MVNPRKDRFFNHPTFMIGMAFFILILAWGMMFHAYWTVQIDRARLRMSLKETQLERDLFKQRLAAYEKGVDLGPLLQRAQSLYSDEEKKRAEGLLWIDRESQTGVITLGAVHGLKPGSRLTVYDEGRPIGEVRVRIPLDVVATVQPNEGTWSAYPKKYYTVRKLTFNAEAG